MSEATITPRKEFSFISLPRPDVSERAQILRNFDGVPSLNSDNILHYSLLRSPSDDPPVGRDSSDSVEIWRANDYQKVKDMVVMSRRPSDTESLTARKKEWRQYLNVMYIAFGPYISRADD